MTIAIIGRRVYQFLDLLADIGLLTCHDPAWHNVRVRTDTAMAHTTLDYKWVLTLYISVLISEFFTVVRNICIRSKWDDTEFRQFIKFRDRLIKGEYT